jgi:NADPH:quinone reductase-like Zn-dependent oxidoreductase
MPIALIFEQTGGPDKLMFRDLPLPQPTGTEVRYSVEAFALNRGDLFWLSGVYYNMPELPARIGQEACGIVSAVGPEVTKFKVGDRVCSLVQEEGRYCVNGEFAVTPERFLVHCSSRMPPEEACAVWSQALTAYYPFVEMSKVQPGCTILVTAGSGTAGNGAIQMGKLLGARVLTTTRTKKKEAGLRALGAEVVIVDHGANLSARLQAETRGAGVEVVFDTVAGPMLPRYLEGLAQNGRIYIVGALSGDLDLSGPILPLVRSGASITGFSVFNNNRDAAQLERAKRFIGHAIERGELRAKIDRVMPFDKTIEAYEYLLSGRQFGKIVVRVARSD